VGTYPRQEFVYGIYVEDYEEGLMDVVEEAGFQLSFCNSEGAVFGFELDSNKVVKDGYVCGFWTTEFDKEYFDKWYEEVKAKMTPEALAKLREIIGVKDEPKLWTISRMG
jgi:hypothetical protein